MASKEDDAEVLCGVGKFRPKFLQFFNNPKALCTFIGLYLFIHGGTVTGVQSVNTTAFERRFNLNSVQVGWITSCIHISAVTVGTIISFFGARRHKARWLAMSVAVGGSGFLLKALPHFLTGPYQWGQTDEGICTSNETACFGQEYSGVSGYWYVFMSGSFLCGISASCILTVGVSFIDDSLPEASSPLYIGTRLGYWYVFMSSSFLCDISAFCILTVGVSFIDDSLPVASSPLYIGVVFSMRYVGIAAGYLLGGQALRLYVDFDTVSQESWFLTLDDPRWVGAWWLPYCVAASLYVVLFLAFSLYGSELPAARQLRETRQIKALEDEHLHQDEKTQYQVTGLASMADNSTVGAGASTIENDDKVISDSLSNYDKGILTNNDMFITDIEYDSKEKNNKGLILNTIDKDYEMPRNGIINPGYMDEKVESYKRIENKGVGSRNFITNKKDDKARPHLKVFVPKLIEILKSPTFVFLCFAVSFTYMLMTSVSVFLPKLIQNQYNHTATMAGILSAILLIPGAALGQFLGGFIMKKLKLEIRGTFMFAIISCIASLPFAFPWLMYCERMRLVGWNLPYSDSVGVWQPETKPSFTSQCNFECNCQQNSFVPVCDSNQNLYFTPCYAGCSTVVSRSEQIYSNCSCLLNPGNRSTPADNMTTVTAAACHYGCESTYYALPMLFVGTALVNCVYIPVQTIILRTHSETDKTFCLGIMWIFIRLIGLIPGPLLLGALLDATCVVWGETCGNEVTSCWIYDNASMARNMALFCFILALCVTLTLLFAFLFYQMSERKRHGIHQGKDNNQTKCAGTSNK